LSPRAAPPPAEIDLIERNITTVRRMVRHPVVTCR
jgi:hypothetical protein